MQTAVINIKTHPETKKKAQQVAQELGISLSGLINGYLKQLIKTKRVEFSLSEEPSQYLIDSLKESQSDIKARMISPTFENAADAIDWLNSPKKRYVYQSKQKA